MIVRLLPRWWEAASVPELERREPSLLASQWRRLSREIAPELAEAGMGAGLQSAGSYPGEEYGDVFVEDIERVLTSAL